jgi:hypothetical protein
LHGQANISSLVRPCTGCVRLRNMSSESTNRYLSVTRKVMQLLYKDSDYEILLILTFIRKRIPSACLVLRKQNRSSKILPTKPNTSDTYMEPPHRCSSVSASLVPIGPFPLDFPSYSHIYVYMVPHNSGSPWLRFSVLFLGCKENSRAKLKRSTAVLPITEAFSRSDPPSNRRGLQPKRHQHFWVQLPGKPSKQSPLEKG